MPTDDFVLQLPLRMYCIPDAGLYKYNQMLYERVMETFDKLPIACILNGKFFCVHGGISPDLITLADVTKINRFQ
jgi:serine/threonine-protein phosphatase 2B catalytic subunit